MSLPPDLAVPLIAVVIAGTVLGFLRVIGFAYYNHVMWHNLRIQVHELRLRQQQRLHELALAELEDHDVDIVTADVAGTISAADDAVADAA